ncbi:MAG: hypothetical protein MRJ67_07120 [Nitrospirales bacterium]|nr:hypothetical protein [Nitrospirales bacterium]
MHCKIPTVPMEESTFDRKKIANVLCPLNNPARLLRDVLNHRSGSVVDPNVVTRNPYDIVRPEPGDSKGQPAPQQPIGGGMR